MANSWYLLKYIGKIKEIKEVLPTTRPVRQKVQMSFKLGIIKLSACSGIF